MNPLPIPHPTRIYPDLDSLIDIHKNLSRDDKVLDGLEFGKVKFSSPKELTFTTVNGVNTFGLSDYSLKQFLDLLQFSVDAFHKIRDDRLRAEVVNSILKDIAFDIESQRTSPEPLPGADEKKRCEGPFSIQCLPGPVS